ncbi:MAG TPA: DUF4383 domain-containing protein [Actinomycetota bacterium]|nr:DUF4383 domain-containing protein [Actinomycetota bacterium]
MATTAEQKIESATWSPARVYLVVSGFFLVAAAAVGFGLDASFPSSSAAVESDTHPHIFGIFETNGWHNLAALISGVVSLGFAVRPEWARLGAFVKGTMYVGVTVSIAVWGPETFLIASNTADQVVHGTLGAAGLVAGFATRSKRHFL